MRELPFDAPAVERGVGFFETVLLLERRAVLWDAHVRRLQDTLARFALPVPTTAEVEAAVTSALHRDQEGECALRLTWLAVGKDLDDRRCWRLDASTRPIPPTTLARRAGSHAVTLGRELVRDTPGAKSTSYLSCVLGLRAAIRLGADEGLFVDAGGAYLEGTAAALIAWDGGGLLVPHGGVLPSVTAAAFIGHAPAEHGALRRTDLQAGAVLVGALTRAAPLLSIDGAVCEVPQAMAARIHEFNDRLLDSATAL